MTATTIIASVLIGAAIAEFAKFIWANGGRINAVIWTVMALTSWVLMVS